MREKKIQWKKVSKRQRTCQTFFWLDKFGHTLEIFGIIAVMKYEMCIERGKSVRVKLNLHRRKKVASIRQN